MLAKAHLYQYPLDYKNDLGRVGAYATFNSGSSFVGYRPTHATCLMRNMLSRSLCSVCKENIWMKFLNHISLIDSVGVDAFADGFAVTLKSPAFAHTAASGKTTYLTSKWFNPAGAEVPELADHFSATLPKTAAGSWKISVALVTPEIRNDPQHIATDTATVVLGQ